MRKSTNYQLDLPAQSVSFDWDSFNEAATNHGVAMVHWRACRCPIGMVDIGDLRRPHDDHSGCSNGFLYSRAGTVTCLFTSNSLHTQVIDVGLLTGAAAQITVPRYYDNTDVPAEMTTYDRLYLAEEAITVPHWQLVVAHESGVDRLDFPAVKVIDLIDNRGVRYTDIDYQVVDGRIHWTGNNRPIRDLVSGKGQVYTIRYSYRPYFYVKTPLHEVRVSSAFDPISGEKVIRRMPQLFLIQREYVAMKEDQDREAPDSNSARQVTAPPSGNFGPR